MAHSTLRPVYSLQHILASPRSTDLLPPRYATCSPTHPSMPSLAGSPGPTSIPLHLSDPLQTRFVFDSTGRRDWPCLVGAASSWWSPGVAALMNAAHPVRPCHLLFLLAYRFPSRETNAVITALFTSLHVS